MYEEPCLHTLTAHFMRQLRSVLKDIYYQLLVCRSLTEKTPNLYTLSIREVNLRLRKGTENTLSDKTWNIVR